MSKHPEVKAKAEALAADGLPPRPPAMVSMEENIVHLTARGMAAAAVDEAKADRKRQR